MEKLKRAGAFLIAGVCVGIGFFLPFVTYHHQALTINGTVVSDIVLSLRDYSTVDADFPDIILTTFISLFAALAAFFFLTGCVLLSDSLTSDLYEARLRRVLVRLWVVQVVVFLSLILVVFYPDTLRVTVTDATVSNLALLYKPPPLLPIPQGETIYDLALLSTPGWGIWMLALGMIIGGVRTFIPSKKQGEAKAA